MPRLRAMTIRTKMVVNALAGTLLAIALAAQDARMIHPHLLGM